MSIHGSDTRLFSPGERVPQTGIYECSHSECHTPSKKLVFDSGMKFPLCKICFWSVRYALLGDCSPSDMEPTSRKRNEMDIRTLSA